MDPDVKQRYLEFPYRCPYCGSDEVNIDHESKHNADFDFNNCSLLVGNICDECGRFWRDEYVIANVIEEDDDDSPEEEL